MILVRLLALLVLLGEGDPRWRLELPDGWQAQETPDTEGGTVLASYLRTGPGWRLVVARQRGNTDLAYSGGEKAFFAGLEEGVRGKTEGYKRLSARMLTLGKLRVPAFDLWYRAPGGVRGTRFIIMKSYAVMATIDLPRAKRVEAAARKVIESLEPVW